MFCKHIWVILSETTTKSAIEVLHETGQAPKTLTGTEWFERKHIQIVSCGKCGKLKRFCENV